LTWRRQGGADVASSGAANAAARGRTATRSEVADAVAQRRGRRGCDMGGRQRLAVLPTTVDDVTAGGKRRRARCSTDGAARAGVQWCAATLCDGVAGAAPTSAGATCGDVAECARGGGANGRRPAIVAVVRRRRRTIGSRGGTSAAGRRAAVTAGGRAGTVAVVGDMRRRCCRSAGGRRRVTATDRPSVPRAADLKTSPTAWASGTTSWR